MKQMANLELAYVKRFKDRHGRLRHYYRRPGYKSVSLPGEVGSAEFMAAYAEAAGQKREGGAGQKNTKPMTINALIVTYYLTNNFKRLKPSTKRSYRNMLERFRKAHGDKSAVKILTNHLEAIFLEMRPTAAQNLRKRLRQIFALAVRLGWRTDNPALATLQPAHKVKGHAGWSEADIAAFEAHWATGTRERLALALLIYTGQRRSDVVLMGRQHVSNSGRISVAQVKTDERLKIRLHPKLRAEVDQAPLGMTFLLTQAGKPFSAAGFTNWFVDRANDAGLEHRTPHGLRKAAARRLAEAGCSSKQIAAITGHRTLSEIENYTRDADQEKLMDQAMDKLEEAEARTNAV